MTEQSFNNKSMSECPEDTRSKQIIRKFEQKIINQRKSFNVAGKNNQKQSLGMITVESYPINHMKENEFIQLLQKQNSIESKQAQIVQLLNQLFSIKESQKIDNNSCFSYECDSEELDVSTIEMKLFQLDKNLELFNQFNNFYKKFLNLHKENKFLKQNTNESKAVNIIDQYINQYNIKPNSSQDIKIKIDHLINGIIEGNISISLQKINNSVELGQSQTLQDNKQDTQKKIQPFEMSFQQPQSKSFNSENRKLKATRDSFFDFKKEIQNQLDEFKQQLKKKDNLIEVLNDQILQNKKNQSDQLIHSVDIKSQHISVTPSKYKPINLKKKNSPFIKRLRIKSTSTKPLQVNLHELEYINGKPKINVPNGYYCINNKNYKLKSINPQKILLNNTWKNYKGFLKNNQFEGQGKLIFSDNSRFEGKFCENTIQGRGTFYFKNNKPFHGDWYNNNLI